MSKLECKIVRIIDEYRVVISAGKNLGVSENEIFEIYTRGSEIVDPDTREILGTFDYIKGRIKAVNIFDKITVCESALRENKFDLLGSLSEEISSPMELNVDSKEIDGDFVPEDTKIHVGDSVRSI